MSTCNSRAYSRHMCLTETSEKTRKRMLMTPNSLDREHNIRFLTIGWRCTESVHEEHNTCPSHEILFYRRQGQ